MDGGEFVIIVLRFLVLVCLILGAWAFAVVAWRHPEAATLTFVAGWVGLSFTRIYRTEKEYKCRDRK